MYALNYFGAWGMGHGAWEDEGDEGVWGVWGKIFVLHPPTPPTPPTLLTPHSPLPTPSVPQFERGRL